MAAGGQHCGRVLFIAVGDYCVEKDILLSL